MKTFHPNLVWSKSMEFYTYTQHLLQYCLEKISFFIVLAAIVGVQFQITVHANTFSAIYHTKYNNTMTCVILHLLTKNFVFGLVAWDGKRNKVVTEKKKGKLCIENIWFNDKVRSIHSVWLHEKIVVTGVEAFILNAQTLYRFGRFFRFMQPRYSLLNVRYKWICILKHSLLFDSLRFCAIFFFFLPVFCYHFLLRRLFFSFFLLRLHSDAVKASFVSIELDENEMRSGRSDTQKNVTWTLIEITEFPFGKTSSTTLHSIVWKCERQGIVQTHTHIQCKTNEKLTFF